LELTLLPELQLVQLGITPDAVTREITRQRSVPKRMGVP